MSLPYFIVFINWLHILYFTCHVLLYELFVNCMKFIFERVSYWSCFVVFKTIWHPICVFIKDGRPWMSLIISMQDLTLFEVIRFLDNHHHAQERLATPFMVHVWWFTCHLVHNSASKMVWLEWFLYVMEQFHHDYVMIPCLSLFNRRCEFGPLRWTWVSLLFYKHL